MWRGRAGGPGQGSSRVSRRTAEAGRAAVLLPCIPLLTQEESEEVQWRHNSSKSPALMGQQPLGSWQTQGGDPPCSDSPEQRVRSRGCLILSRPDPCPLPKRRQGLTRGGAWMVLREAVQGQSERETDRVGRDEGALSQAAKTLVQRGPSPAVTP